ncbi:hypothetical protein BHE74_00044504, partial [Ensete ventricosum]
MLSLIINWSYINCVSGSADRTVKFWDLETFELIGSAGPETINKSDIIPVIVPRTNPRVELSSDSTK